jgi:effector-binding domain-containing protein
VTGDSVRVVAVDPRPTAVVAETTTWPEFAALWPRLLDEVYAFVRPRDELAPESDGPDKWQNVMLYKDDRPSVEVGVLVRGPFEGAGRVVPSELPGGRAVMGVHRGDYSGLGQAYEAIRERAAAEGLELAAQHWEIYGHPDPDPGKTRTEVYWLLR